MNSEWIVIKTLAEYEQRAKCAMRIRILGCFVPLTVKQLCPILAKLVNQKHVEIISDSNEKWPRFLFPRGTEHEDGAEEFCDTFSARLTEKGWRLYHV